ENPDLDMYSLPLAKLRNVARIQIKDSKHIQESLKELMSIVVDYNILGKDKQEEWGAFTLLSEVKVTSGEVYYAFPPSIKNALLNPRMYARINIAITRGLSSKYSLALYEVARDYVNVSIPHMTIKTFRNLMGLDEGQYENFPDLRRRVIEPAIDEINLKTDLGIELEYIKDGRKVIGLKFSVREQTTAADGLPIEEAVKKMEEMIVHIPELIENDKFMALARQKLDEKGFEYVTSNIQYAVLRAKKNVEAYTVTALEEDFAAGERAKASSIKQRDKKKTQLKSKEEEQRKSDEKKFESEKDKYMNYYNQLSDEKQLEIISEISAGNFFGPREIKIMTYLKSKMGVVLD
ncbi:MAG: RepB family plasmid replication initiator protein, partial [Deltaproteobacteria bacterium]|nr:RepB family plasmid replication initiator protein [Deltaproteobacteria bacterium]